MKPDGYFEILTPGDFVSLMSDRDVRSLFSVGPRTADKLYENDIHTVRDIADRREDVISLLGTHGAALADLAEGKDDRPVVIYLPEEAKSISRELTFQEDVSDTVLLKDVLLLLSINVTERALQYGLHGSGVSLKVTYSDMRTYSRSRISRSCDDPLSVQREAADMLDSLKKGPVRLIGVGLYNLSDRNVKQMTFDDYMDIDDGVRRLDDALEVLHKRYRFDFVRNIDRLSSLERLHGLAEHMRIQRYRQSKAGQEHEPPKKRG